MENLTEVDEFTQFVSVPEPGDDRKASSVVTPLQALANRTFHDHKRIVEMWGRTTWRPGFFQANVNAAEGQSTFVRSLNFSSAADWWEQAVITSDSQGRLHARLMWDVRLLPGTVIRRLGFAWSLGTNRSAWPGTLPNLSLFVNGVPIAQQSTYNVGFSSSAAIDDYNNGAGSFKTRESSSELGLVYDATRRHTLMFSGEGGENALANNFRLRDVYLVVTPPVA